MTFNIKQDYYCDIILMSLFVYFLLESVLNSVISKQYRFSFVFLLDTISTFSLLLDITEPPFIDKTTYSQFKQTILYNFLLLLSVLKLWRATRLFFRKNQTKTLLKINQQTMKLMKRKAIVSSTIQHALLVKKKTLGLGLKSADKKKNLSESFAEMVKNKTKLTPDKGFQLSVVPSDEKIINLRNSQTSNFQFLKKINLNLWRKLLSKLPTCHFTRYQVWRRKLRWIITKSPSLLSEKVLTGLVLKMEEATSMWIQN